MSDELELAKTGMKAAVDNAFAPLHDLIMKIAGPAAEELGYTLRDQMRFYRLKRQVRLLTRTKEILADVGEEPKPVPLKILEPIFEAASLEEDDTLQDKWAALLANAATIGVHPAYPEILKQLSSDDVSFLDYAHTRFRESHFVKSTRASVRTVNDSLRLDLDPIFGDWMKTKGPHGYVGFDRSQFLGNVTRLGLVEEKPVQTAVQIRMKAGKPEGTPIIATKLFFTQLGLDFVRACQEPKRKG